MAYRLKKSKVESSDLLPMTWVRMLLKRHKLLESKQGLNRNLWPVMPRALALPEIIAISLFITHRKYQQDSSASPV